MKWINVAVSPVIALLLIFSPTDVGAQQPEPAPVPCGLGEITVKPGAWKSAEVFLRKGQVASIRASGIMRYKDGPRIDFGAGGDRYGVWSLKAKLGSQIVNVRGKGEITAIEDGQLELGAPAGDNTPVAEGSTYLDSRYHYCATVKVAGENVVSSVRIVTTRSCVPEDNENVKPLGRVKVTIGGKTVTTDENGTAVVQLPAGEYPVTASWEDAVVGYVYQAGTLFRPFDSQNVVKVQKNSEAVEVRMMTCDKTGQPKARARISEIGYLSSMQVTIHRVDTGRKVEQPGSVGLVLRDGDILTVKGSGKLDWIEGGIVTFDSARETSIVIGSTRPGNVQGISITRGVINFWFNSGKESKFEGCTRNVCFSPKGTRFSVGYDEQSAVSSLKVDEGEVAVIPRDPAFQGSTLRAGQQVDIAGSRIGMVQSTSATVIGDPTISSSNVSGKWTGPWRNVRREAGRSTISLTEAPGGIIQGDENGWPIVNGKRVGNMLTWEYRNQEKGCRNYQVEMTLSPDGRTMSGTYYVVDSCAKLTYTGTYDNYRRP